VVAVVLVVPAVVADEAVVPVPEEAAMPAAVPDELAVVPVFAVPGRIVPALAPGCPGGAYVWRG